MKEFRRLQRHLVQSSAWRTHGDAEANARIENSLDRHEPQEQLPPQCLAHDDGRDAEFVDQHFAMQASRCHRAQQGATQDVFVGGVIAAQDLGERRARPVELDGNDEPCREANPMNTGAVLDELQRASRRSAAKHSEEIAQRGRLQASGQLHGPSFGPSRCKSASLSPRPPPYAIAFARGVSRKPRESRRSWNRRSGRAVAEDPRVCAACTSISPGDDAFGDGQLARRAAVPAADDEANPHIDIAAAFGPRGERKGPAPDFALARCRLSGSDASTKRLDERRRTQQDHVTPDDRLAGIDLRFDLASHPPRRVDAFAVHRGLLASARIARFVAAIPRRESARVLRLGERHPRQHGCAGRTRHYETELSHGLDMVSESKPMRSLLVLPVLASAPTLLGCDKSGPLAELDASSNAPFAVSAQNLPPAIASPAKSDADGGRVMPQRPVPTSSPTVLITMPQDVQLRAIQYMAAMQAPQPSDAAADPAYAKQIADQLRGPGKTDVISSGRRIDILLDKGCDATEPREAVAHRTGASLGALLAHGVLVVRCTDRAVQCLQSTRDTDDVLCTHR